MKGWNKRTAPTGARDTPKSTTTKPMATQVQQMLVQMATREMSPKPFMPKALGMELMMRPPADKPTKNMNRVM